MDRGAGGLQFTGSHRVAATGVLNSVSGTKIPLIYPSPNELTYYQESKLIPVDRLNSARFSRLATQICESHGYVHAKSPQLCLTFCDPHGL